MEDQGFKEYGSDAEKGTVEWLEVFRNEIDLLVLRELVEIKPSAGGKGYEDNMTGLVVCPRVMDSWIGTAVSCLTKRDTSDGHFQKLHFDTYWKLENGLAGEEAADSLCKSVCGMLGKMSSWSGQMEG